MRAPVFTRTPVLRASHRAAAPVPYRALLLDVGGTLLTTAQPVVDTYLALAHAHGAPPSGSREEAAARLKAAFKAQCAAARADGRPRYTGGGALFWGPVVAAATRCDDEALLHAALRHYEAPSAWIVAPGAQAALARLRAAGVKLSVASNWDTRLRPLLERLGLSACFDALAVSAELECDKPDARFFHRTLGLLGDLQPHEALHVGDSAEEDVAGARGAGLDALHWGVEVSDMAAVADVVLAGRTARV